MTHLEKIHQKGQSIWLDYIRRSFIESGELKEMIDKGVRGVTSNPTIFDKAIGGSSDYDGQLREIDGEADAERVFELLAIEDIRDAAEALAGVYTDSGATDGFVSFELSPRLSHDTDGSVQAAARIFKEIDRSNVMIKIPATKEGIPAIQQSIADGININVTLIFSLEQYNAVAEAYISGLEERLEAGKALNTVASVASVFLSRIDSAVDDQLEEAGREDLKARTAIANAQIMYHRFTELFSSDRWKRLAEAGARVQKPLWASTSVKDPALPETYYVEALIAPDTVNTLPPSTLEAVLEDVSVDSQISSGVEDARQFLSGLSQHGISMPEVLSRLLEEGVEKFADSYDSLLESIVEKRDKLKKQEHTLVSDLGDYTGTVKSALDKLRQKKIMRRIWEHDHTVWKPDPEEISNRLGWLHIADTMLEGIDEVHSFTEKVRADGYTHAVLMGMGGSSLAPEVFARTFAGQVEGLQLQVADTTDPDAITAVESGLPLDKTLFVVSTKSGGTVETLSLFKHFYNKVLERSGAEQAGRQFVAITDPGSKLIDLGKKHGFRKVFLNDPNIGGRYSALSFFGIVPAALTGLDVDKLLSRAAVAERNADSCNCPIDGNNRCARLGVALGELAKAGRDKVTLIASEEIESFGDWVEQLIAESTGKEGKGILPVVGEPALRAESYGDDRLFVFLILRGDISLEKRADTLQDSGHPVIRIYLDDLYDMGQQFFIWEMATAVAGHILAINPFDQPNVESAKTRAKEVMKTYADSGALPEPEVALQENDIRLVGDVKAAAVSEAVTGFLERCKQGRYVSLQAYIHADQRNDEALQNLAEKIALNTGCATTIGIGPRFLHSTGQLHKGDGGKGLFLQIVSEPEADIPIPEEAGKNESAMPFGVLKKAQALGDRQALLDADREVLMLQVPAAGVAELLNMIGDAL